MGVFRLLLVAVAIVFGVYLSHQLTRYAEIPIASKLFVILIVVLSLGASIAMPLFFWSDEGRDWLQDRRWILNMSYYGMAYLSALLALVVVRDAVGFVGSISKWFEVSAFYRAEATWTILAASAVFVVFGAMKVAMGPQWKEVEIKDSRLPAEFEGFKIVQISDLHISDFVGKKFIEETLKDVSQQNPDIVVLTGDIIDGDVTRLKEKIDLLGSLKAPLGVYFVPGNHEYYWNLNEIHEKISSLGIKVLLNRAEAISRQNAEILIAGVADPTAAMRGSELPHLEFLQQLEKTEQFRVLLAHQPNIADLAAEKGIHLQLSGHTHGGQFFPWNFLIGLFQKYSVGHFWVGDMQLYVNEGTAYWGPAVRFGTNCEKTVLNLRRGE